MSDAPDWIPFQAARWMAGTGEMDMKTEFVFFRLCIICYQTGSPVVTGSDQRNAMRCKVSVEEYSDAIDMLTELEKVDRQSDGVFVPSTAHRLGDAKTRLLSRQRGAAIARRRRELNFAGKKKTEVDQIISKEFPDDQSEKQTKPSDDQSGDQPTIQTDNTNKTKQTDNTHKGGVGGEPFLQGETVEPWETAITMWNEMAKANDLSIVQRASHTRKSHLAHRLKDCGGLEGWSTAMEKVAASDFLCGRMRGKTWKATFDFVLQPSSFTKIMENQYQNRSNSSGVMDELRKMQDAG